MVQPRAHDSGERSTAGPVPSSGGGPGSGGDDGSSARAAGGPTHDGAGMVEGAGPGSSSTFGHRGKCGRRAGRLRGRTTAGGSGRWEAILCPLTGQKIGAFREAGTDRRFRFAGGLAKSRHGRWSGSRPVPKSQAGSGLALSARVGGGRAGFAEHHIDGLGERRHREFRGGA